MQIFGEFICAGSNFPKNPSLHANQTVYPKPKNPETSNTHAKGKKVEPF